MEYYRLPPELARELIEELRPFGHESGKTIAFEAQVYIIRVALLL